MPKRAGAVQCRAGKSLRRKEIGGRFFASTRHCRRSFHEPYCPGLLPAPSCRRRRGSQSSHIGPPIQFGPIAWREHLRLAAKRPTAGLGGSGTAGAACLSRSARHPRRTVKPHIRWGLDFAACAVNWFIASAGTLTLGAPVPTRMPSGTVLAWSPGSSGMRPAARFSCCGASKVGAVLKAAGGCGGTPKLTIASRCLGSGANTETRPGRDCWLSGLPNLQVINRDVHAAKCVAQARDRCVARNLPCSLETDGVPNTGIGST